MKSQRHSSSATSYLIPLVLLGVALLVAVTIIVSVSRDRDAIKVELTSTRNQLSTVQTQLDSTKATLASTQSLFATTNQSLVSTRVLLVSTNQTLASTNQELAAVTLEFTSANQTLTSTKQLLASTQAQVVSTNQSLIAAQSLLTSANQVLVSTNQSLISIKSQLATTNQTLISTQNELSATKTQMNAVNSKLKLYEDTMGIKIAADVQPNILRGDSSLMHLNNVVTTTDPSWQQLVSFLLADPTDDNLYRTDSFDCVDFAEMLHNNAEAAGIRSAFVAVNFKNDPIGHAINAFKTTDRGLVYIDVGGGKTYDPSLERDKVAYLAKDKELGFISLSKNIPFDYTYYTQKEADYSSYLLKLDSYSKDVEAYEWEILGRVYYIGTPEYYRMVSWYASLEAKRLELINLQNQLRDFWPAMSIVSNIQIYW